MPTNSREETRQAAWASLRGLSVGDALGQRFFGDASDVIQRIGSRRLPSGLWRFTDETVMAAALFEQLLERDQVDQDDLARRLAQRYREDPLRGYDPEMQELLFAVARGAPWREMANALFGGTGSPGNGAAARVAPLGIFFADSPAMAAEQAALSAEVTHAHREGIAGAIAIAVAAAGRWVQEVLDRQLYFETILEHTPPSKTREGIERAAALPEDTTVERAAGLLGCGSRVQSCDTVPFCIWCVATYPDDFETAFWSTVEALGDRDTTCAIVGGILGAVAVPPGNWQANTEPLPVVDPSSARPQADPPSHT